jgi:hypothetical protein
MLTRMNLLHNAQTSREKLIIAYLVKTFPTFHATRSFIPVFDLKFSQR